MKLATIETFLATARADYAARQLSPASDQRKLHGWWKTHRNRIEKALISDGADDSRARSEANRQMNAITAW